jgi:ATP10 protein
MTTFAKDFKAMPQVNVMQVSAVQHIVGTWPIRSMVLNSLKQAADKIGVVSPENTFVWANPSQDDRKKADMYNERTLYVFMVDNKGRIRWKSGGLPTSQEEQVLPQLMRRLVDPQADKKTDSSKGQGKRKR